MTDTPVAVDSPDHLHPLGTAQDNNTNEMFVRKLQRWLGPEHYTVLDLGCAGGAFVKSVLMSGGFAVGIEGSDYSFTRRRAEWATIPEHLFLADVTKPFDVRIGPSHWQFDAVTAWEVLEHLREEDLPAFFRNVLYHMRHDGVFIASVATYEASHPDGARLHQTVRPREWWLARFALAGFAEVPGAAAYFGDDWVRGGPSDPASFPIVLSAYGFHQSPRNLPL